MKKDEVIQTLMSIENLPTLPIVVQQIMKLMASPKTSMSEICVSITRDQSIAAKVIRLTNSAFYGLRSRVTSIEHAIVILGLNTVRNLVLGVSVVKTFEDSTKLSSFDRKQFWLHTFCTAMGSKLIAKHLKTGNEDDYFLAGLLHDIGILAIDQFLHQELIKIIQNVEKSGADFLTSEMDVLGMSHGGVGGFIADKWDIPAFLVDTIKYHHTPQKFPDEAKISKRYIEIVHAADHYANKSGVGTFIESYNPLLNKKTINGLGIAESDLEEIFEEVKTGASALMREWGL